MQQTYGSDKASLTVSLRYCRFCVNLKRVACFTDRLSIDRFFKTTDNVPAGLLQSPSDSRLATTPNSDPGEFLKHV